MKTLSIETPILLFGAGSFGRKVAQALLEAGYRVAGFVDANLNKNQLIGLPVYTWQAASGFAESGCYQLVCSIFNRDQDYQQLVAIAGLHGWSQMLLPWDYYPLISSIVGWQYWLSADIAEQDDNTVFQYDRHRLNDLLADDESRRILARTLAFRRGDDLDFSSYRSTDIQYFNALTLSHPRLCCQLVYLDVGAYDGDSLFGISSHCTLGRAILVEPSPNNLLRLRQHLVSYLALNPDTEVDLLPLAFGDHHQFVALTGDGEAATLWAHNTVDPSSSLVQVVRADDLFPNIKVDFVKIDAEGSDLACIRGMSKLLRDSRPVIAVSTYHRADDIVKIPLEIISILGESYQVYLRQHRCNSFDSICYAVPDLL